jgi:hypothetical protein
MKLNFKSIASSLSIASLAVSSAVAITSSPSLASDSLTFACIKEGAGFATVGKKGNATTPPLISWQSKAFSGYEPEARCNQVNKKLQDLAAKNGGKLSGIKFKTGSVRGSSVICSVTKDSDPCTSNNHVMNIDLKPYNGSAEAALKALLGKIANPSATGNALQNSSQSYVANVGDAIQAQIDALPAGGASGGSAPAGNPAEANPFEGGL